MTRCDTTLPHRGYVQRISRFRAHFSFRIHPTYL
ncbi:unnamed protein product [Ixodes persulcatus]